MKKTVLCKYCGKEFSSYNPTPTFCSLKCKGLSQTIVIDFRKAMELYGLGMTKQEVANRLNTTRKVTENTFKRHNFKCRKAYKRNQYGVNNHTWSGDNPSYSAAHRRLIRKFGKPKKCEVCGSENQEKFYDWASLTGDYNNFDDYKRMCRSCHWKLDKTYLNFYQGKASELSQSF